MRMIRSIAAILSMAACSAWAQVTYQWTDIAPEGLGFVSGMAIQPIDGRLIISGSFTVGGAPASVMYSNDHGSTWKAGGNPPTFPSSLFVHPGLPGVVYAQTDGFSGSSRFGTTSTEGTVYRSDDFGRTWSLVYTAALAESIQPFGSDPLDTHAVYALRKPGQGCSALVGCLYGSSWQVMRTPDDGRDWTGLSTLLGDVVTTYSNPIGPTPANPTRLFVQGGATVLVSNDRGATFSRFATSLEPLLESVVPDPLRPNVVYATRVSSDVYFNHYVKLRSDDAGASWHEIYSSILGSYGPPVIDPARSRTLWIGPEPDGNTTYAMHRSDDAGNTWQPVPYPGGPYDGTPRDCTIRGATRTALMLSPAEPGVVYVLTGCRFFRGVPSIVPDPIVVEYQYEGDRYWLTSLDGEAVLQDYRQQPGDVHRTGVKWGAWNASDAPAGAVGSCRFWPKTARTRVLVQQGFECDILKRDPNWILEAENEFFTLPPTNDACPAGTVTVNRFINLQPDFNHRWVADRAIAAEMKVRGWYDEGVRFCARPLGSNE